MRIGRAAELVLRECLSRVARHGLHQRSFVAALRYPQRYPAAALSGQPLHEHAAIRGQLRHQDLAGDTRAVHPTAFGAIRVPGAPVELGDELLDQLRHAGRSVDGSGLVDRPAPFAAHPSTPDVEHLDGCLEIILREGDDVGIRAVGEDHRLLLQCAAEGVQVVA